VKNNTLTLKKIHVRDTTGKMQVSLWIEKADVPVSKGDTIILTSVQTTTFKSKTVLSSTTETTIKVS